MECGELTNPADGCVVMTGNKPGDEAVYFCNKGFTLSGEKKCKCGSEEEGEWCGTVPTCESKFQLHIL